MVQIQIWNILETTFFIDIFFTCKIRNPNSGELQLPEIQILLAQGSQIRLPVPEVNSHLRRPLKLSLCVYVCAACLNECSCVSACDIKNLSASFEVPILWLKETSPKIFFLCTILQDIKMDVKF